MLELIAIPALQDNYIWLLRQARQAVVIDPGQAQPVLTYLQQHQLELESVLITHQHRDHIDGLADLLQYWPKARVYVPAASVHASQMDGIIVTDQQQLRLFDDSLTVEVIAVPGHTLNHLSYLARPKQRAAMLFCGDTLFSAGCGRLFEGSPAQMWQSLQKLNQLPDDTLVCCAHEYTAANLSFALAVEPNNAAIHARIEQVNQLRQQQKPSLPSTIAAERAFNPFLRCDNKQLQQHWQQQDALSLFSLLREWKNRF